MNREILFRAKSSQSWCYGYVHKDYESPMPNKWRLTTAYGDVKVINSDTIGEWTGLLDKNNVMIFEGDIVKCVSRLDYANMIVIFEDGEFRMVKCEDYKTYTTGMGYYSVRCFHKEVIGNIYDNLELVKV